MLGGLWVSFFFVFYVFDSIQCFCRLAEHSTPEILRTPLHELALSIKLLKLGEIKDFVNKALEPPPLDAVMESIVLLKGNIYTILSLNILLVKDFLRIRFFLYHPSYKDIALL